MQCHATFVDDRSGWLAPKNAEEQTLCRRTPPSGAYKNGGKLMEIMVFQSLQDFSLFLSGGWVRRQMNSVGMNIDFDLF